MDLLERGFEILNADYVTVWLMLIQNGVGYTDYLDNEDLDQEFVDLQGSSTIFNKIPVFLE